MFEGVLPVFQRSETLLLPSEKPSQRPAFRRERRWSVERVRGDEGGQHSLSPGEGWEGRTEVPGLSMITAESSNKRERGDDEEERGREGGATRPRRTRWSRVCFSSRLKQWKGGKGGKRKTAGTKRLSGFPF